MSEQKQHGDYDDWTIILIGLCLHLFVFWSVIYINAFPINRAIDFITTLWGYTP